MHWGIDILRFTSVAKSRKTRASVIRYKARRPPGRAYLTELKLLSDVIHEWIGQKCQKFVRFDNRLGTS